MQRGGETAGRLHAFDAAPGEAVDVRLAIGNYDKPMAGELRPDEVLQSRFGPHPLI
jgi:hypothetical protein